MLLSVVSPPGVRAEVDPPPAAKFRFEYERPDGLDGCPDSDVIESGVSARLGYEPFDQQAKATVRALVRPSGSELEGRIQMRDESGRLTAERRLTSRDRNCAELSAAMALTISIAIDPFRGASLPPPPPPSQPPDVPVSAPSPVVTVVAPPPNAAPSTLPPTALPLRTEFDLGLTEGVGSAPARSTGVSVAGSLRRANLSLGLEGRVDLPSTVPALTGEIRASLLVASLVPCLHLRGIGFCALGTAGAFRAAGQGLVDERQVTIPYFSIGARLRYAFPLGGRWTLLAHADLSAPFGETVLRVGGEPIWRSPSLAGALGLRLGVTFP